MKRIFLLPLIMTFVPTLVLADADIASNANSASCNNTTLHTSSGSSNLTAIWTPNTINITWDDNGATIAHVGGASTCSYADSFNLPTPPQRSGYTFGGWKLKAPTLFDLKTLDYTETGSNHGGHGDDSWYANPDNENVALYGLTQPQTWATEFSYGIVRGEASCNNTPGDNHNDQWGGNHADWSRSLEIFKKTSRGRYCWCRVTTFTPTNGSTMQTADSFWLFGADTQTDEGCAEGCANGCALGVQYYPGGRSGIYGL